MLTIFSTARAFTGLYAVIQRNAITSWTQLDPRPEIIIFGDDPGTAALCAELGLIHVPDVALSDRGTPLISDMFERAQRMASYDTCCLVNSDIILFDSVHDAVRRVRDALDRFLIVGQRWDLDIDHVLTFDARWSDELRAAIAASGHRQSETGIDYFIFPTGAFPALPPFAIGRTAYDNWVIWWAGDLGMAVVDASKFLDIVHQNHDYSHGGGMKAVWEGPEAKRAHDLAGHWSHYHGISHARYMVTAEGAVTPARGLRYRVARPRRAVLHQLRFTRPARRRLRAAWYGVRTLRKQGAAWPLPEPAKAAISSSAGRLARTAPVAPVAGYRFGQVLAPQHARARLGFWALGRFFVLDRPVRVPWSGLEVDSFLGNDLSRCLYVGGGFEPNELSFVRDVLRPGDTMIDVGANEGLYSIFAARHVGPDGRIVAVEPSPREVRRLRTNAAANGLPQITVVERVLLDEAALVTLHLADRHHAGQNTLGAFVYDGVTSADDVDVPSVTLDALVEELGLDGVRLVKIDVEGAETRVLRGAAQLLATQRPLLLLEVQGPSLRHQGSSTEELLGQLADAGYRSFPFSPASGRPTTREMVGEDDLNIVACPTEAVGDLVAAGDIES